MEVEVVVEIPRGSRNKYEMDHATGRIRLDRMLFTSTQYPLDYGFVPDTLAEDGDPLDALVILDEPTFPGCLVLARPVAVFWMADEHGPDAKILTVPARDPRYASVRDLGDVPRHLTAEIGHFFDIYKELEPGKDTDVREVGDRAAGAMPNACRGWHMGSAAGGCGPGLGMPAVGFFDLWAWATSVRYLSSLATQAASARYWFRHWFTAVRMVATACWTWDRLPMV